PAAEVDAGLAAAADFVVANEVIRIAVAEGHAVAAILDRVLLVEAVLGAPAEVDSLGALPHAVAANDRALGAGARVDGEADAVGQLAVFHEDVVRDAPDNAIAVEVPYCHAPDRDAIGFVQANGAVVECPLVEHLVARLVSVDRDILDRDVGDGRAL